MNKYVLGIDGMKCGMCEMHVENEISKKMPVKRVRANHLRNDVIVISEEDYTLEDFKSALDPTGYRVTSFKKAEAVKKLFGWR